MPVVVGLALLLILLLSANGVARAYTEWLWFDNLQLGSVWTTILAVKVGLVVVFSVVFFLILWGNLVLADRLAPPARPLSPEEDLIERYHQLVGGRAGKLRVLLAAVFALVAGGNTASQWQEWLLFRNGASFGRELADPLFNRDPGFYMFTLPFLTFVLDWLFAALILTVIVVTVAHYLNGGIRASTPAERVTSGVKVHLSALLAALAVVRAFGYWFDRFELVNSTRGDYDGALATAVNIQWPAYNLLALVSLFVAALFLANLRRQGWGLPMVAIGLWVVSHLLVGSLFPAMYQRLRVENQASTRERQYVQYNIDATRFAYGLDDSRLDERDLDYQPGVTQAEIDEFKPVLDNVPLVDPLLARDSFDRSEGERAFYQFSKPLDVDRYTIDGELRPVVLSVRGLDLTVSQVGQGWEAQHIQYTHGYGVAMASGWAVDTSGRPRFLVRKLGDVFIDGSLGETLGQPRVYFGENFDGYAIVGASRDEIDYQTTSESRGFRYDGTGGVEMGGFLRRTAFALRFRQLDPLIAPALTSESEVIYNRDVAARVRTVAPFLRFDANPYPVLAKDRIFWVVDGYTTSDAYPYSQRLRSDSTDLLGTDLTGGFNYVRNSVKAVVDAYNGDVKLYIVDDEDPVVETWAKAFPDLFRPGSSMDPEIRDNLRYPEDIFRVQTDVYSTYVVQNPQQLIQGDLAWSVAAQPRSEAQVGEGDLASNSLLMKPQYLISQLPGQSEPEFVLQRAFVPRSGGAGSNTARPELTGIMVARSDPANYGQLVVYRIPNSAEVEAPDFVHSEIRKSDQLTEFVKEKLGSVVSFGEMSLLLVNDTIIYVRPVYVEAASATAVPELSRVIAVNGDRIEMGSTLAEAVAKITDEVNGPGGASATVPSPDVPAAGPSANGSAPDSSAPDGTPGEGTPSTDPGYDPAGKSVVELVSDAETFLQAAEGAEAQGRAEEAATLRARAQLALTTARDLLGGQGVAASSPAPTQPADT